MSFLNYRNKYKYYLKLLKDKYWDFVLSIDDTKSDFASDDCVSVEIDPNCDGCILEDNDGFQIASLKSHKDAYNDTEKILNIGLTGLDNGFLPLTDITGNTITIDEATDEDIYDLFTTSEAYMYSGDTRLRLYNVTGYTNQYSYDMCVEEENGEKYFAFSGGFLQGVYKLFGYDYQLLPQYIDDEWGLEFVIRPRNYYGMCSTINDANPKNKGIFFYMGTRSENKFAGLYGEDLSVFPDREISEGCDCKNPYGYCSYDESDNTSAITSNSGGTIEDLEIEDSNGLNVKNRTEEGFLTDNKYLLFDRTKDGFTTDTWVEGTNVELKYERDIIKDNLFLTLHRAKNGQTTDDILKGRYVEQFKHPESEHNYNIFKDLLNNAFALKIDEDMRIGYRYLVKDCDSENGFKIEEEYSYPNIIKNDEWNTIYIKIRILNGSLDDCGKPKETRKMKIYFYVNGYLKMVSQELDEFNFRELNDKYTRQELVPYNLSIGGGALGMAESIWTRYHDKFPKLLPIEENFAGTFIGDIKSFKFYTCPVDYHQIRYFGKGNGKE